MMAILLALLLSILYCGFYLRLARRWQLLDVPNARSSHALPTPHGGGAPLILALVSVMVITWFWQGPWPMPYPVLVIMALLLMVLGVADDQRGLSVGLRFSVYGLCCFAAVLVLVGPDTAGAGGWSWLLIAVLTVAMLWFLNLYNFMDGIDGLAAGQCVLACLGVAVICKTSQDSGDYVLFCLLLAACHGGFLLWNWPPAKLFMGDAGSIPTGFMLAALCLLGWVENIIHPACWLILLAVFITDASGTLLWRLSTGQAITQPHRLHAYQRLSRLWASHKRVDVLLAVILLCWLFPLAWAAQQWPQWQVLLVILAYLPLLSGMAKVYKLT